MITASKKIHSLFGGLMASMLIFSPVMADDTEIYLGTSEGLSEVNPNILFIIDNSGSMSTMVRTQSVYDPNVVYSGSCDVNRVYWTSGNSDVPTDSCGNYVDLSAVHCKAALDAFQVGGLYQDRVARYSSNEWRSLSSSDHSSYVECKADNGVHGRIGTTTNKYAADGNNGGPWRSNSSNDIKWNNESTYTLRSGNFRNWQMQPGNQDRSRLDIVKDSVRQLVSGLNDVNIGLMHFDDDTDGWGSDSYDGGLVAYAMEDVATARTLFLNAVDALSPDTYTPLGETMYEAARYYRGDDVYYGDISEPLLSVAASRTTGTLGGKQYKTPITSECQKSFIVYLTDGDPTQDSGVTSSMMTNIGADSNCSTIGTGGYQSNCLDDIAATLAKKDQNSSFIDNQVVRTFTIGFGTGMSSDGITLLKSTATAGEGDYYPASDTSSLINAFTNILGSILQSNSTFSSPAVSVNAFNRTTHLDHLYFSLFRPVEGAHWDGNLKRYRLDFNTDGEAKIVDVNNVDAIDIAGGSGYFKDSARSYWTPDQSGWAPGNFPNADNAPDGAEARKGGTASVLTNSRAAYTYTGSSLDLTAASNALHETNAAVTEAVLGVASAAERDSVLQWARGIDVNDEDADGNITEARKVMGDPLHGEPALISYGGTPSSPDITAYVPTNDGYLHAFSTIDGTEHFSFVPQELLSNLLVYYRNDTAVTKTYGLDGSVTAWVKYTNPADVTQGIDKAYIYFGMRRGGNNYYAMDVTNRNSPKLMWTIKGGSGDFAELGQSWSKPKLRKLRVGGQDKYVLVFGGGYDTTQDGANVRTDDSIGRAIYIVDAETGQRLWWASSQPTADLVLTDMDFSIPSEVSVVDSTGDGYANLMYVGDMGGQVWRFDISKSESASSLSSLITGGRIADLAIDGSTADTRRFYYPPEVAVISDKGSQYISLILGSGYRAHPLYSEIQDRIYMIRDLPIKGAPTTYTTLTESDLFDTTNNAIGEGSIAVKAQARSDLSSANGWYIDLEVNGEKALAKPVIFAGMAFITTYIPTDPSSGVMSCAPREGSGRVYIVDVTDGRPTYTNNPTVDKDDLVKDDRFKSLNKAGIPADPKFIKTDNENQKDWAVCVGTECFSMPNTSILKDLYWFER